MTRYGYQIYAMEDWLDGRPEFVEGDVYMDLQEGRDALYQLIGNSEESDTLGVVTYGRIGIYEVSEATPIFVVDFKYEDPWRVRGYLVRVAVHGRA